MSLTTELKISYKTEKHMKKLMGRLTGYQIACGRKLCKIIDSNYSPKQENNNEKK